MPKVWDVDDRGHGFKSLQVMFGLLYDYDKWMIIGVKPNFYKHSHKTIKMISCLSLTITSHSNNPIMEMDFLF